MDDWEIIGDAYIWTDIDLDSNVHEWQEEFFLN